MMVCEILYKPEEFSDTSQHIVVPDARMVKVCEQKERERERERGVRKGEEGSFAHY